MLLLASGAQADEPKDPMAVYRARTQVVKPCDRSGGGIVVCGNRAERNAKERLPLPRGASIRVRIGDARQALGRFPAGLVGQVDVLVADVYAGAQIPAHLTSVEFYAAAARLLGPDGVLLVNVADGAGLAFARRQVATVREVLANVIVLAEVQTLKGRRFGNLVVAASASPLPTAWLPRLMAAGPHPAKVAEGAEIEEFVRGARPATDADAVPSPKPSSKLFER